MTPGPGGALAESPEERRRRWDLRFLDLARLVARWSKDPSRQVGAAVVRPDRSVASVGFNGFPAAMPDGAALYADKAAKRSRIVHAEINATLFAREPVRGYTLYTWPYLSCDRCAAQLLQAGIARFVAPRPPAGASPEGEALRALARQYCAECGAEVSEL